MHIAWPLSLLVVAIGGCSAPSDPQYLPNYHLHLYSDLPDALVTVTTSAFPSPCSGRLNEDRTWQGQPDEPGPGRLTCVSDTYCKGLPRDYTVETSSPEHATNTTTFTSRACSLAVEWNGGPIHYAPQAPNGTEPPSAARPVSQ